MPQQVKTASASMWTKRVIPLGVLFGVAATAIGTAAPASADSATYLKTLQPTYAYLSASQLQSAGSKVCSAMHSGMPASDVTQMLSKDMGVSVSAAYEIVIAAINHLGC